LSPSSHNKTPEMAAAGQERLLTRNFALACLTTFAAFTSFYLLLATLPLYLLEIGGSASSVGLIIGVFGAVALVLRPFVGRETDIRGKGPFIMGGLVILAASSALYTLVRSVPLLLGLRVLHGVGWASFTTAASALVADLAPRRRRGEAMGYFGMFNNLAMAVGPALGIELVQRFDFQTMFLSATAIAAAGLVLSLGIHTPKPVPQPGPQAAATSGVIEPSALFPALVLAVAMLTYGAIVTFLPIYAVLQGISNPGVFFTVYAIVVIVARGFTGRLSDTYGRAAVATPGIVLAALGLWVLAFAGSLPQFLLVAVLYGGAFAMIHPTLMAMVVDRAHPSRRGAAMGTFSSAMDLGISGGSIVWGFVAQAAGYQAMFLAAGFVAVVALLILVVGTRHAATHSTR
jgi:MFS family permease